MKTTKLSVLSTILLMGIGSILYGQENGTSKFSAGVRAGYNRGYGMQVCKIHFRPA